MGLLKSELRLSFKLGQEMLAEAGGILRGIGPAMMAVIDAYPSNKAVVCMPIALLLHQRSRCSSGHLVSSELQ